MQNSQDYPGYVAAAYAGLTKNRLRQKMNPHWQERRGRESAAPVLAANRVASPAAAAVVMRVALAYSEFQVMALYRPRGYFPKKVDYDTEMPLLPQLLSPFFGKVLGELAFASYAAMTAPEAPPLSFLSLGAGRACLDHDLIAHVTGGSLQLPGYEAQAEALRKDAAFRVTDLGEKAVSLARKELAGVISSPKLRRRVRVEAMDALDFALPEEPFGVVYSNELIDNLPAEPVISLEGALYAVKVVAFARNGAGEAAGDTRLVEEHTPLRGVISRERAQAMIDAEDFANLGFAPVFVPLEYDAELGGRVRGLRSAARIDEGGFGGIYPVHIRLEDMFRSIRKSFRRGVVFIIDYPSVRGGWHNWNLAVNIFRHYRFGNEDIDFQIDPDQLVEVAERCGLRCADSANLGTVMNKMKSLALTAGPEDIRRNMAVNGYPFSGESREAYLAMHAELISQVAPAYEIITFQF